MSKQPGAATLPPKELSIFKRVVKYYDQKQYKNALKYANQILGNPRFSEHGETLAMKGILLNCLGKKEEAREYVKRGLNANISSFVCWHIYGLVQKSDRKYEEAIKCYLQALRLDSDNLQVLRDLSVLQMQLRNYDGCKDTRYKLLMLRPSQRASWIGYALIHHLLGHFDTSLTILNEFRKGQGESSAYENSELLLYQVMVLIESEKHEQALSFLEEHSSDVVDIVSLLETKVRLLLNMKRFDQAKECALELIDRNPENRLYFDLLCEATVGLNSSVDRASALESITSRYSRSRLLKRIMLDVYSGDTFKKHLDAYLQHNIRKGVPPLFLQLVGLWSDVHKTNVLEDLVSQYRYNIETYGVLSASQDGTELNLSDKEPPSTSLWLYYFIANYLNYQRKYKEALDIIDTQLRLTPTLVDFYVLRATIYNDAGDVITASRWMEEAQSLDAADRYINALCTKFMVQAHRLDDATAMASKFTRGKASAAEYLSEMQCMWFLTESARSLRDMGKYGDALKLCHEVEQHYRNILDDQLDFHSYCLRKGTLRAYVDTLRLEDRLRDHHSYFEVSQLAVEIYLQLHAQPLGSADEIGSGDQNVISPSEAKKLRNKQRKAARRAEAEAARSRAEQERREQAVRSRQPPDEADTDRPAAPDCALDPYVLARPCDALEEACIFLRPLLDLSSKRIEVYCLAYEVYERKQKVLLMLKSILHGVALPGSSDHPWFHDCCTRFLVELAEWKVISSENQEVNVPIYQVLVNQVPTLFPGWPDSNLSPTDFNEAFLDRNAKSYPHVFRATLLRAIIEPSLRDQILLQLPLPSAGLTGITWEECSASLNHIKKAHLTKLGRVDQSVLEKYRVACHKHFPMAVAFFTDAERCELQSRMVAEASETAVCGVYTSFYEAESLAPSASKDVVNSMMCLNMHEKTDSRLMVNGDICPLSSPSLKQVPAPLNTTYLSNCPKTNQSTNST